jgi:hypothetical protein
MLGALADLIGRNRNLLEQTLERVRRLEDAIAAEREPPIQADRTKRSVGR